MADLQDLIKGSSGLLKVYGFIKGRADFVVFIENEELKAENGRLKLKLATQEAKNVLLAKGI